MGWLSPIHKVVLRNGGNRPALRRQRKLASSGDLNAYCELVSPYVDLVTEYLYLSGVHHRDQVVAHASEVIANVWTRLPYTQRLSDFERLLALSMKAMPIIKPGISEDESDVLHLCMELTPDRRFLLVAREMEGWHQHWLALACRRKTEEVHDLLAEVRGTLAGVDVATLSGSCRSCLNAISRDMDQGCDIKTRANICERMASMPQIKNFKGNWLEQRCNLIELRQQIRLEADERQQLFETIVNTLSPSEMLHPQLVHRLRNTIHFENFPEVNSIRG